MVICVGGGSHNRTKMDNDDQKWSKTVKNGQQRSTTFNEVKKNGPGQVKSGNAGGGV